MKGLSELLNEVLLNESVSVDDVNSAIDSHNRILINYRSNGGDEANGARVIEVYAYGLTKAGNPVIRAFQPYGDTTSKVPSWKFFRLDRIIDWKPTEQTFSEPASDYYHGLGDFNPNGDGTMSTVYKIAKFGGEEGLDTKDENSGPKLKSDVFKTDTEKQMARTREQLKNPITLSDLKAQQGFKDQKVPDTMPKGPVLKDKTEQYKTPTERGMERLRQQLENPKKIDLSQFEKPQNNTDNEKEKLQQALGNTSERMTVDDFNKRLMNMRQNEEPEPYKTETEQGIERLRKQLENPTKIDLSKFENNR